MNKAQKFLIFFPEIMVIDNILSSADLLALKEFFEKKLPHFEVKKDESTEDAYTCQLIQMTMEGNEAPQIYDLFEQVKNRLELMKIIPSTVITTLQFYRFWLKYYRKGDSYQYHQDISVSGLSFVFQMSLKNHSDFNDLEFADGRRIAFADNQMIIFHSALGHRHQAKNHEGKAIIFSLPRFS